MVTIAIAHLIVDTILPLPGNDAILDYLSVWEKQLEKEKVKKMTYFLLMKFQGKEMDSSFKFLFKRKILTGEPTDDLKLGTAEPVVFAFIFQQVSIGENSLISRHCTTLGLENCHTMRKTAHLWFLFNCKFDMVTKAPSTLTGNSMKFQVVMK